MRHKLPDVLNLTRQRSPGCLGRGLRQTAWLAVGVSAWILAPAAAVGGQALNTVSRLQVKEQGSQTVVRLRGSRRPNFSVFKLERPPRLTVDLANCRLAGVSNLIDVDSWAVSQIATTQFQANASTISRVMINFRRRAHYNVRTVGSDLVVTISPHRAKPPSSKALSAELARAKKDVVSARGAAAKAQKEARVAREAASQQRARAADQARRLDRVRRELGRSSSSAKQARQAVEAFQRQLEQRAAELRRLRADARTARAAAKQQPRVARLQAAVAKAEARARRAQRDRQRIEALLKKARAEQTASASARRQAEAARALAERRRREAEQARNLADARAKALAASVSRVRAERARLGQAARQAARLRQALADTKRRELAHRQRYTRAEQQLQRFRQAAASQAAEQRRLSGAVSSSRALEQSLKNKLSRLDKELAFQRQLAAKARRQAARFQREAAQARRRVAAERSAEAKQREARKLRAAEARLNEARKASARVDRTRQRVAGALAAANRSRLVAQRELTALRSQLAAAERRLPAVRGQAAQAQRELTNARKALDSAVAARHQEEAQRSLAERRTKQARRALSETQRALADARTARAKEQRALSNLRRAQVEAERKLAQTSKRWRSKQVELDRQRKQLAQLASSWKKQQRRQAKRGAASRAKIRDLKFIDRRKEARIELELDGQVDHRVLKDGTLALSGVELPRRLERTLDTSAFKGPVRSVSSFVVNRKSGTVHVKVDVSGSPRHRLARQGSKLIWAFDKPAPQQAMARAPRRATKTRTLTEDYRAVKVGAARSRGVRLKRKRYTGRRIDLDFKGADIHNILRLLSDVGNVNIITSDAVAGSVTIRMKNVPWDHGLDVILRAKGLGMVREGNLLRVAPRADLEKEREAELARQKQVVLLKPLETRLIPLSYATATGVLPKLQYSLSPRGKLTFDERTNTIIARDIAANLNLVEQMIRNLDTQTPQVLIEARIVEARTNYSKQLGIQWGGKFTATAANGNSTGLVFPNEIGIGGGTDDGSAPTSGILLGQDANPNFLVNMPAGTGLNSGAAIGLALGSLSGAFNLSLRLSAAEATGDIRIVSSPRITTLDNVAAKISQGVTIPFAQVSANGVNTTFKDAKLDLSVTPHVTADGSVVMKISINKNEPDFVNTGPRGDPTILTKQATTEMLVKDGQTAVIGGIYTTRDGRAWNKVPWLAEIPILGWFFKNRRENSDREEVLVFITPRIINRAESIGN